MSLDIATRAFRDRSRARTWWVIGSTLYALVIAATFPAIKGQDEMNELMAEYPEELLALFAGGQTTFDLTMAADYVNSQLFAFVFPLLLAILGVSYGASTLAGEEERGTLDLVLAHPVARSRLVFEKALVLAADVFLVTVAVYVATFGIGRVFSIEVPLAEVLGSAVGQVLLGAVFGLTAMLVGALTGHRGLAIGVGAGLAGATYLLASLAPVISWVEPTKWISPFYYAVGDNPLVNGLVWWHAAVLVVTAVVLLAATVVAFDRHDLRGR